ncbi:DUF47 domain-containing protein [Parasphaerochaeta coccoides]|uniref:Phosphate transport regulator n=1 Tax=Parasphaerochaeta coccoides (strain ATCC BAA-1237 / DSM 17374 / SPN1) TaxID=760011 RepID=F4GJX6_PARC1|nr:DUF47 family protein [Parasphaerochaeta coccoides]AEC01401.1 putative phosphate transport regulator [Parasphaerochaeta coccoides DSM 17374]
MLGKKKETNYYHLLTDMIGCSVRCAVKLDDLLRNYTDVENAADAIHAIEHEADEKLHDFCYHLNRAFITPIDREDLLQLGSQTDSITDAIEDISLTLDMLSVKTVREDILPISTLMVKACVTLQEAFKEFEHFKTSKNLARHIIDVNHCEESADRLYRSCVKTLYADDNADPLMVIRWKEIYEGMESVMDACEDVADLIEAIAIKNR